MHLHFKQAVCLGKKDYRQGDHHLSDDVFDLLSKDETFLKYKELGLIHEKEAPSGFNSDSILERNKKLAEKTLAPKVEAPVEAKSAESMDESSIEAAVEEVKEASSKKNRRR